jgi:hypothetical protein
MLLENLEPNELPNSYEEFMETPDLSLGDGRSALRYDKNIISRFFALLFEPEFIPVMREFNEEIIELENKLDDTDVYVLYHMLQYAMNGAAKEVLTNSYLVSHSNEKI